MFDPLTVLKFVRVWSKHLYLDLHMKSLVIVGHLWKSSVIFRNFRKMFRNVQVAFGQLLKNLRKVVRNLWKIIKTSLLVCLYHKQSNTMVAGRYMGFSFVLNFIPVSHKWAQWTSEILSWTLDKKFYIYAQPCIILYLMSCPQCYHAQSFENWSGQEIAHVEDCIPTVCSFRKLGENDTPVSICY